MTPKKLIVTAAFLAVGGTPLLVQAQDINDPTDPSSKGIRAKADKDDIKQTISVTGVISTNIGQGTFVTIDDEETQDDISNNPAGTDTDNSFDRVSMGYSIIPSYAIDEYIFSTRIGMTQWLTAGGGIDEPNEIRFSDIPLNFSWTGMKLPGDINFNAGGGLQFPTSETSQTATLILGTGANVAFTRTFLESITLIGSLSGGKDFHRSVSPVIDPEEVGIENVLFREGEEISRGAFSTSNEPLYVQGGVNSEYSLTPTATVAWRIWELSLAASYGVATFWTYNRDNDDEFTPTQTDTDGNLVADTGRGVGQVSFGSIRASYRPTKLDVPVLKDLTFALSAATSTSPKTADNRSFNFPFWNFGGAAANRSRIGLSVSYNWSEEL